MSEELPIEKCKLVALGTKTRHFISNLALKRGGQSPLEAFNVSWNTTISGKVGRVECLSYTYYSYREIIQLLGKWIHSIELNKTKKVRCKS